MRFAAFALTCFISTVISRFLSAGEIEPVRLDQPLAATFAIPKPVSQRIVLNAGKTVEVGVRIDKPSALPTNARLRVVWSLVQANDSKAVPRGPREGESPARKIDAFGIPGPPTANWSKLLHALDADVTLNYRAAVAGLYELRVSPEEGDVGLFNQPRWREPGQAPQIAPIPSKVRWPKGAHVDVSISMLRIDVSGQDAARLFIEAEPNDTPEQAQPIPLLKTADDYVLNVVGSADDIEYFDNGDVGRSGDDWFRLEYSGTQPRLLTACLSIPDQQVAARIRAYRIDPKKLAKFRGIPKPGQLLPVEEYETGKNSNERVHQQKEQHRIAINRRLEPGGVYFLRVEANAPGYDLELRVVEPAPYTDARRAIRHALYDHIGQVDSWLTNRPRGASVERRIRDSGNLLGTNCMSCHTQSGVWGPAIPFANGYRPQNIQPWRHLINTCYQSLRPTNKLKDAANNTSLRPLDIGDGPAGTRVAGHAVISLERFFPARKLQSMQARRTANYVLQTSDPGGINAAGPGANVGQGVVFNYAGEIVWTAWKETGKAKYFHSMEDKARRMLGINVKYSDDLAHRVEFFSRYFPKDYLAAAIEVAEQEKLKAAKKKEVMEAARQLDEKIRQQVARDVARLRGIQLVEGGWSFDPGVSSKDGKSWEVKNKKAEPSPTALALIALEASGVPLDDDAVQKGIDALLRLQHPSGYWKGASQTGFVATSYAVHALSRYFPAEAGPEEKESFAPRENETLAATIRRVRDMAVSEEARFVPLLVEAAGHESPLVRFWAMLGLGYANSEAGVSSLTKGLGDRAKMVREAAHWGLRQTLIDDKAGPRCSPLLRRKTTTRAKRPCGPW